jgi:putative ABC transport system permease protein
MTMTQVLTFIRLAARNVLRNRSRSALTLGAIFSGVALTVLLAAFGNGLGTLMTNDLVFAKTGALQIHRKGYADQKDNQPLKLDMPAGGELEARIRAVPGVAAAAPRLVFGGMVNNGSEATMFVARGIDADKEYATLPWAARDVVGRPVTAAAPTGGVIGAELGEAMGVKLGGSVVLQSTTQSGQQNALDLDIAGTLDNANFFESKRFIHVPLSYAQDLVRMRGRVTEYAVAVKDVGRVDAVAAALRAALGPDYEVETWRQLQPNLADVITFQRVIIAIISIVFLIIVVFGVVNTMVMSVLERTREIGTMMALGVRRARIGLLFLLEAAILAGAGAGLGAAVARAVVGLLAARGGFAMAAPGSRVARYHLVPVIPPAIIALAVAASIAGALCAAVYPSWKATRLRPVEALRAI